jgi:hypothetical protein
MDQQDPSFKRLLKLTRDLAGCYIVTRKMLLLLPIPVELPAFGDADAFIMALVEARNLVKEEPMPSDLQEMLDRIMVEWLAAYDIAGVIQTLGMAPWRLDAMDAALDRMTVEMAIVGDLLGYEPDTE